MPAIKLISIIKYFLLGSKIATSTLVYKDLPGDDPKQRRPDISVAKSLLDWSPEMDVDEGLKRTIRYFEGVVK